MKRSLGRPQNKTFVRLVTDFHQTVDRQNLLNIQRAG